MTSGQGPAEDDGDALQASSHSDDDEVYDTFLRELAAAPPIDPKQFGKAPDEPDLTGRELSHFRLLSRVAAGGMGVVYEALDTTLQRVVAVKVLSARYLEVAENRTLLLREAQSAAAVSHPNVAAVYEVGETEGITYIAMEYVKGSSLRTRVRGGPLPVRDALELALDVARGLAAAHRAGIVHRDLKPDNIMVSADGQVKILDFGLAKRAVRPVSMPRIACDGSSDSRVTEVQGTPGYMSPEQAMGQSVDARTDIYSFGVMVFELIAGVRPLAHDLEAVEPATARQEFERVLRVERGVVLPPALQGLLMRCMAPAAHDRYRDGSELVQALESLHGQMLRPRGWHRARWLPWVLGAGALVAVGQGFWLLRSRTDAPSRGAVVTAAVAAPASKSTLRRLTANVATDNIDHAVISPDGKTLAYVDTRGLHLRQVDGPSTTHVPAPRQGKISRLAWFPDGKRLAASVWPPQGERQELWAVAVSPDQESRQLALADPEFTGIAVSPDGTRVAYAENDRIGVMTVQTGQKQELVPRTDECITNDVVWSPSGQWIAYASLCTSRINDTSLRIIAPQGGNPKVVLQDVRIYNEMVFGGLVWLASGELVFPFADWLPAEPGANLFGLPIDEATGLPTGPPRQRTSWIGTTACMLSCNTQGTRLSFLRFETQVDVYVGELRDGGRKLSQPRRLTMSDRNERVSAWSRDSRGVYYFTDQSGTFDLFYQDLAANNPRPVVTEPTWDTMPQLSPRGDDLLFWHLPPVAPGRSVRPEIWRWPLRGGALARVVGPRATSHPAGVGRAQPVEMRFRCPANPSASCILSEPADKALVFYRLDAVSGVGALLFRMEDASVGMNFWDVLADGTRIVMGIPNGPLRVMKLDGTVTAEAKLPAGCDPLVPVPMPDGSGLIANAECGDGLFRLFHADFDGHATLLWQDPPNYLMEPEVSPDGRHLAVTVKRIDNDVWMVDDF